LLLGWTSIDDRPFYVRQMKNMKGSIPIESLTGESFNFYAFAARFWRGPTHTPSDAAMIASYCGKFCDSR